MHGVVTSGFGNLSWQRDWCPETMIGQRNRAGEGEKLYARIYMMSTSLDAVPQTNRTASNNRRQKALEYS